MKIESAAFDPITCDPVTFDRRTLHPIRVSPKSHFTQTSFDPKLLFQIIFRKSKNPRKDLEKKLQKSLKFAIPPVLSASVNPASQVHQVKNEQGAAGGPT